MGGQTGMSPLPTTGSWGAGDEGQERGAPSAWEPVPVGGWSRAQAACRPVLFAEDWTEQALHDSPPFPTLVIHYPLLSTPPHPPPNHGLGIGGLARSGEVATSAESGRRGTAGPFPQRSRWRRGGLSWGDPAGFPDCPVPTPLFLRMREFIGCPEVGIGV